MNTDSPGNIWNLAKAKLATGRPLAATRVMIRLPCLSVLTENSIRISAGLTGGIEEGKGIGPPDVKLVGAEDPGGFGSLLLPEGEAGRVGSRMLSLLLFKIVIGSDEIGRDEKSKDL